MNQLNKQEMMKMLHDVGLSAEEIGKISSFDVTPQQLVSCASADELMILTDLSTKKSRLLFHIIQELSTQKKEDVIWHGSFEMFYDYNRTYFTFGVEIDLKAGKATLCGQPGSITLVRTEDSGIMHFHEEENSKIQEVWITPSDFTLTPLSDGSMMYTNKTNGKSCDLTRKSS